MVWAPAPPELDPIGSPNDAEAPTERIGGVEPEVSSCVDEGLGRVDPIPVDPEVCEPNPLPRVLTAAEVSSLLDPDPADCDVPA